jgi:hypothetical protein
MLKHIPKSDINLRPFKVYKTFTFAESDITASLAYKHTGSIDVLTETELKEHGLYHQLYSMYYRDPHNPFTSYGDILPISESYNTINSQRYLSGSAYVLPIPQKYYGEGIKKGSVILTNTLSGGTAIDDSYGNLVSNINIFTLISLDVESGLITFLDSVGTQNTLIFNSIDIDNGVLILQGQLNNFNSFKANINDNSIYFVGIITGNSNIAGTSIGNIFYQHGIITITKGIDTFNANYFNNYNLQYKSTNTIYENEYLLVVGEDEFNISTNSTAYIETNVVSGSITTTYEGNVKYKNSDKYQKELFTSYEYSSSIDTTGSFAAPYITTIGLYDDNMDMVAVAKLAKPVKSMPDLPVNFLVRFDS